MRLRMFQSGVILINATDVRLEVYLYGLWTITNTTIHLLQKHSVFT